MALEPYSWKAGSVDSHPSDSTVWKIVAMVVALLAGLAAVGSVYVSWRSTELVERQLLLDSADQNPNFTIEVLEVRRELWSEERDLVYRLTNIGGTATQLEATGRDWVVVLAPTSGWDIDREMVGSMEIFSRWTTEEVALLETGEYVDIHVGVFDHLLNEAIQSSCERWKQSLGSAECSFNTSILIKHVRDGKVVDLRYERAGVFSPWLLLDSRLQPTFSACIVAGLQNHYDNLDACIQGFLQDPLLIERARVAATPTARPGATPAVAATPAPLPQGTPQAP